MEMLFGGGSQSSDLNDMFAALSPANKPVFKKVFGDTTTWKTKSGRLTFSFVFDPKREYKRSAVMASAWNDPFEGFREALQRHLLSPDVIAPIASEAEVVWQYIRSNVPNELLAKHVESIDDHLAMLSTRAKMEYVELTAFTDALTTTAYDFAIEVAIDAYPVPKSSRRSRRSPASDDVAGGPRGVCTLHIKHELGATDAEADVDDAANGDDPAAASESEAEDAVVADTLSPAVRPRSLSNASTDSVDFATTHLPGFLGVDANTTVVAHKFFPRDASDFFSQVEAWFSATVKKRTQELVEAMEPTTSLYN